MMRFDADDEPLRAMLHGTGAVFLSDGGTALPLDEDTRRAFRGVLKRRAAKLRRTSAATAPPAEDGDAR